MRCGTAKRADRPYAASVASSRPPVYAWNWLARQTLLWREVRGRLAGADAPVVSRYADAETRPEVIALLREDYPRDAVVRGVVRATVGELVFLGRTDEPFERLGVTTAPRGMRWWWTEITGEPLERAPETPPAARQLTLDDVHRGYG